jgi:hypothetical protein
MVDKILHQDDVEEVINDEIDDQLGMPHAVIADVASPSAGYVQAEAVALRNAVNGILATLRTSGQIATS